MDVMTAIKERRSVRSFTDRPVSRDQLTELLTAAVWAPSGGNRQTWRFTAVSNPDVVKKVKLVSPGMGGRPTAVIAVAHDMDLVSREDIARMDSAMAAQNILLAAHAMGLGGCVIASFNAPGLAKVLSFPPNWQPHLLVSLGYPAQTPAPPVRKFEEIIEWEQYDG